MKKLILILSIFLTGAVTAAPAEYIKSFDSVITVNADGSMDVIETIVYVNQNIPNKHGIFREFPTRYVGPANTNVVVYFEVKEILRNSKPENFRIEDRYEGKSIRIGSASVIVEPGTHTYTIRYHTDLQLGFLEKYDMLRWNVTGNGWPFFIEQASASVKLPAGIALKDIYTHGYTGSFGSDAKDFTATVDQSGIAHFTTTRPLQPYQGLTIEVSWPKGFTQEPPSSQKNS